MKVSRRRIVLLLSMLMISLLIGCGNNQTNTPNNNNTGNTNNTTNNSTAELQILATSDVHDYLVNYDYYTLTETDTNGLVKLATLVKEFRAQAGNANSIVLVDNGDLIQGNPLGDYFARVSPMGAGETHPIYQALQLMGYDAAGLGNHEFNYGLDYLHQIIKDSQVPIINANVYNAQTGNNEFQPYVILNKNLDDGSGNLQEIKVGVISFVPTQILNWDRLQLEGKVTVEDIKACAEKFIPQMKQEGADLIVALAHTGYGSEGDYVEGTENVAYYLTLIDGIDVVVGGHSHETFPSENFISETGFKDVDLERGTINGTFTVQPTKYAEGLGVVTLQLQKTDSGYQISDGNVQVISPKGIANDEELQTLLMPYHEAVINYVNGPVGKLSAPLNSYFALIGDDASVQLISDAQLAYGRRMLEESEQLAPYKDLPLLSAAAPFKAGLAKGEINPSDYVVIPAGNIAIKDVASLYKYPNTATIVKLNGAQVREWLEMSAGMYNTVVEGATETQPLLNNAFVSYNFDTIDGVTYEVDITQPARYDADGNLINKDAHRIVNLQYDGKDLEEGQEFLVITNNYRAGGGGNFPIFTGNESPVVYSSSDETRQIISDYIASQEVITPKADGNWRLKPVGKPTYLYFESAADATNYEDAYPFLTQGNALNNGLNEFIYNLHMQ